MYKFLYVRRRSQMTFAVSPSVTIREIDLTGIVPNVSTTEGAFAGVMRWGPVEKRILVDSQIKLVQRFGKPSNFNPETWFTCSNFLDYANRLYISRAADTTGNTILNTAFVGNSTALVWESGNNELVLANSTVGNTDGIIAGMVLNYSNNAFAPVEPTVVSVNSTVLIMSASATGNIEVGEFLFRDDIVFTSVAQQSDISYDMSDVGDWDEQIVKNDDHYAARQANGDTYDLSVLWVARYPGLMGDSLRVSVCDSNDQYKSNNDLSPNSSFDTTNSVMTGIVGSNVITLTVSPANTADAGEDAIANAYSDELLNKMSVGDLVEIGNTRIGFQFLQVKSVSVLAVTDNVYSFTMTMDDELKLSTNSTNDYVSRYWEFYNNVDVAPTQSVYQLGHGNTSANDELHIVVEDKLGKHSGSPGQILEVWPNLSRAVDAKSEDGSTIYYKDVLNQQSLYVWWANHRTTARANTAPFLLSSTATVPLNMTMIGGWDGKNEVTVSFGTLAFAYDQFQSAEDIDISLVMQGKARGEAVSHFTQLGNYIIDNICEKRLDCVAFISPDFNDTVHNTYEEVIDVVAYRNQLRSTSYAVMDSGHKYQYDKFNDIFRWIPMNGDIAGLCARVDRTNDPWWSPAGYNRGHIKNIVRLAYNPRRAERDSLYKAGVNPVITNPGQGTILFGDKTLLAKPSAFDRINVRRLFITLEKAIAIAAKFFLFEFNDDFTRAQFRNMVNPYLRDIKGRRGLFDFLVVCDATNNTPEVIDRNEFIGDIYLKPARSINFILLNFVAVRTGVAFSEVVGKFG